MAEQHDDFGRVSSSQARWIADQTLRQKEVTLQIQQIMDELMSIGVHGIKETLKAVRDRQLRDSQEPPTQTPANSKGMPGVGAVTVRGTIKQTVGKKKELTRAQEEAIKITQSEQQIENMASIRGVKGNPLAVSLVLEFLKHRCWQLRCKALSSLSRIASSGDTEVFHACISRLNDWHEAVRMAALTVFRVSPCTLQGKVKAAKDVYELGPEYTGGEIVCRLSITSDKNWHSHAHVERFETGGQSNMSRPVWNEDFELTATNPDEDILLVDLVRRGCEGVTGDVLIASGIAHVCELLSGSKDKSQWIFLKRAPGLEPIILLPAQQPDALPMPTASGMLASGSIQMGITVRLGPGIGIKGEMHGVIELLEPALYDKDYRVRRQALQVFSEHVLSGDYEYTLLLINTFNDNNPAVRGAAVEGFRLVCRDGDQVCCSTALEAILPLMTRDTSKEYQLACMEVVQIAGPACPDFVLPDSSTRMIQVVVSKLDDFDPRMRRSAIKAFGDIVVKGSREALVIILPFLSDKDIAVRMAAYECILKLAGSKLDEQGPPLSKDVETVRAIVENYVNTVVNDGISVAGDESQAPDAGLHFALAFQLGIYHEHRARWDNLKHARLSHVKQWADAEWKNVTAAAQAEYNRAKKEQALVNNVWVRKESKDVPGDNSHRGYLTENHQVAIEKAEKTCIKKIQSHWKRYLQQKRFVTILQQKRAAEAAEAESLKAAFVQPTREEQDNPVKSSSVSAGLEQCSKMLVKSPMIGKSGNEQEAGRVPQELAICPQIRKVIHTKKEQVSGNGNLIPVCEATGGVKRLGMSKHIASRPHFAKEQGNPSLQTGTQHEWSLPSLTPERPKNWGAPSRHTLRRRREGAASPEKSGPLQLPDTLSNEDIAVDLQSDVVEGSHEQRSQSQKSHPPHPASFHTGTLDGSRSGSFVENLEQQDSVHSFRSNSTSWCGRTSSTTPGVVMPAQTSTASQDKSPSFDNSPFFRMLFEETISDAEKTKDLTTINEKGIVVLRRQGLKKQVRKLSTVEAKQDILSNSLGKLTPSVRCID